MILELKRNATLAKIKRLNIQIVIPLSLGRTELETVPPNGMLELVHSSLQELII